MNNFFDLQATYNHALENKDTAAYIEQLSDDALSWWLNLDIARVAMHFAPIQEFPKEVVSQLPLRLSFIAELLSGEISSERIVEFYDLFQNDGDVDAATFAVGAGYQRILDNGSNFYEFSEWRIKADVLLKQDSGVSPLASAFLLGLMGFSSMVYEGDSAYADVLFARQLAEIETTGSISQKVYHAAVRTYIYIHNGDLSSAEILIQDVLPLCDDESCSLISKLYLQATHGLYRVLTGELDVARQILDETVKHPLLDKMPPFLWLLTHAHRLVAYAYSGDRAEAANIALTIRNLSIPKRNAFYHAYMHYSLGVAAFNLKEYRKALVHAEESIKQADKCESRLWQVMLTPLLKGQALLELSKKEQALTVFQKGYQIWEDNGFNISSTTAAIEEANILISQNRLDEASDYYQKAKSYLPEGEPLHLLHRSEEFLQQLKLRLFPADHHVQLSWQHYPIRIKTLGQFKVDVGVNTIHDGQWKGSRTKQLLKLLIVKGGSNVSNAGLIDLLWPDTDDVKSKQNLKVTLWRLRQLGADAGESLFPWLDVEGGRLSIAKNHCIVDSVIFEKQIKYLLSNDSVNVDELNHALELYQGDFLTTDVSNPLIIEHRERLRQLFIAGIVHLFNSVSENKSMERVQQFLMQARELDPLNEEVHALLMRFYLKQGFPAKAIQSFHYAEKQLKQELGIQPGLVLQSLFNDIK